MASSGDHGRSRAGEAAARSGWLQAGVAYGRRRLCGCAWRSAHHWEHEVGDAVALNADRWVAEQHVVSRELAEEGAVALAHHDRDEVDGHLVEQTQVQALPGDGATGDRDDAVASERLCMSDCGRYTVGHEGERCLGGCADPARWDP